MDLKALCSVKEASLKGPHTARFHSYDNLQTRKLVMKARSVTTWGVWRADVTTKAWHEGFCGVMEPFCIQIKVVIA